MTVQRKWFVGTVVGRDYSEVGQSGRVVTLERAFVVPPATGVARLKMLLRRPLKWLVRTLYLGPVFVVAALLASAFSPVASDWITVGFVCVLVAFFGLLAPYLAVSAIAFRVGETGRARLRLPFTRTGSSVLDRVSAQELVGGGEPSAGQQERIRLRGTVVELEPRPTGLGPIVVDGWFPDAEPPSRVTEAVDFAIVGEQGQVAVVECQTAPTLIAPPSARPTADALDTLQPASRRAFSQHGPAVGAESGEWVTLRAGDEVEVTGTVVRALPNVGSFELSGQTFRVPGGSTFRPYRGASNRSGLVLRCDATEAAAIQKLPSGT